MNYDKTWSEMKRNNNIIRIINVIWSNINKDLTLNEILSCLCVQCFHAMFAVAGVAELSESLLRKWQELHLEGHLRALSHQGVNHGLLKELEQGLIFPHCALKGIKLEGRWEGQSEVSVRWDTELPISKRILEVLRLPRISLSLSISDSMIWTFPSINLLPGGKHSH